MVTNSLVVLAVTTLILHTTRFLPAPLIRLFIITITLIVIVAIIATISVSKMTMDVKTKTKWLCDILAEALNPGWCMQLPAAFADDKFLPAGASTRRWSLRRRVTKFDSVLLALLLRRVLLLLPVVLLPATVL